MAPILNSVIDVAKSIISSYRHLACISKYEWLLSGSEEESHRREKESKHLIIYKEKYNIIQFYGSKLNYTPKLEFIVCLR
jgi:hypothetical protein